VKLMAFTVYDSKAEGYLRPFFAESKPLAIRAVQAALSDPSHSFAMFPGDYVLYHVGFFDPSTGKLENGVMDSIVTLVQAKAMLENAR